MSAPSLPPAPLLTLPEAPAPPGAKAYYVTSADGVRLRALLAPTAERRRGAVVLSPGRTEPIEKYFETIGDLQGRGFDVLCHDWRGQGRSGPRLKDPLCGHAKGWRRFLADLDQIIETFKPCLEGPLIAVGHSMGGGLTALALAEGRPVFDAAVLSAPMLGLNLGGRDLGATRRLAKAMTLFGRSTAQVAPMGDPLLDQFESNVLTHDRGRWERSQAQIKASPDLRLAGFTFGWLDFALDLTERVRRSSRISALTTPVTVLAAAEEKLVDNGAIRAFAERAPQGRYIEVAGARHEILMETDARRAVFFEAFDAVADAAAPRTSPSA